MIIDVSDFMAIKPVCSVCKNELEDFGAILLGPPDKNDRVVKYHICKDCYKEMSKGFSKEE